MKNYSIIFLSLFVFVFVGCTNSQVTETQEKTTPESAIQTIKTDLSTSEFEAKIKSEPTAPLIDAVSYTHLTLPTNDLV